MLHVVRDPGEALVAGRLSGQAHDLAACTILPFQDTSVAAHELIAVFDGLADTLFFLKDTAGCYTHVNLTMACRLGLARREDAIGHTPAELYPSGMGEAYLAQDRRVLRGEIIENLLEVQLFPNRAPGWCLTHKRPLRHHGVICGLVGISRDLGQQPSQEPIYARLRMVVDSIQQHYTDNLRVKELADLAGMSLLQLERHFKRVFHLTPQQMLTRLRIGLAMDLLRGHRGMAGIAQACGFADQSAFTRQFKAAVGMTPRDFRMAWLRQAGRVESAPEADIAPVA